MKKITRLVLPWLAPSVALGAAVLLVAPPQATQGFSLLGSNLNLNERDCRLRNNFADASANNNTTADLVNFPGYDGAEMAMWKGATEWGSQLHGGTGAGDPTQTLGNGNANFDFTWQGNSTGAGTVGDSVTSVLTSCGGGTLAFVQSGGSGWTMKFCDNWSWSDGPGFASGGQFDIQGVGCHEYGHSLGLGHSNVSNATMWPSTPNGNAQRSIEADDIAGVQAIYGVRSGTKPSITALSYNTGTGIVDITGTNFGATGNEVWFTNTNVTSPGSDPRVRVTNVSSTGGGTQISVSVPANAGSGDVLVKLSTSTHASLSNAFPLDIDGPPPPPAVTISSIFPSTVDRLMPGTDEAVGIFGSGFVVGQMSIEIDGLPIATSFTVNSDTFITFDMPDIYGLGTHTVEVIRTSDLDSDSTTIDVVNPGLPQLQVGTGDDLNPVTSPIPFTMAWNPGRVLLLVGSPSSLPSTLPGKIALNLGASFTQTYNFGVYVMNGDGVASSTVSITGVTALPFYFQPLHIPLPFSFPLQQGNLQSVVIN